MSNQTQLAPNCCGLPMTATDHEEVRVWKCVPRPFHPEVYENIATGERIGEGQ